jgi:hypothetical protein
MFEVKNLRSNDQRLKAEAQTFLVMNPSDGIRLRPADEIDRSLATGQCLVLTRDGEVCGVSFIYKFALHDSSKVFSEIGTMRITANGFGLQGFLARLHLMQIFLEEADRPDDETFAVVEAGTGSEHNLVESLGMTRWEVPGSLRELRAQSGVPFSENKYAIFAPRKVVNSAFSDLKRWHTEGRTFQTPKGRETVEVNMGWFDALLLNRDA